MTEVSFATILGTLGHIETLREALTLFETVEMPSRNLAVRTRQEYTADLADLTVFLEQGHITQLVRLQTSHLRAYLAELDRRGLQASSRHRKTYALKIFFTFLYREGYLPVNLGQHLVPPTPPEHEPRYLSEQEYTRLLSACSANARDSAIIVFFLQTGMRLAELAGLKLSDIELPTTISPNPDDTGLARIRRKGGTIDTIALNYKACEALLTYLRIRPPSAQAGLFVTRFDTAMSRRAIQYMMSKYLEEAGIVGASVHKLRHTFATHHVARGTDLKTVQDMLGHATLATTEIYVSPAKKVQRQALQEHAL